MKKKTDGNKLVSEKVRLKSALMESNRLLMQMKHVNETLFFVLNDQCLKIKFILDMVVEKSGDECKFCKPEDGEHNDDCPTKMLDELRKEIDITISGLEAISSDIGIEIMDLEAEISGLRAEYNSLQDEMEQVNGRIIYMMA